MKLENLKPNEALIVTINDSSQIEKIQKIIKNIYGHEIISVSTFAFHKHPSTGELAVQIVYPSERQSLKEDFNIVFNKVYYPTPEAFILDNQEQTLSDMDSLLDELGILKAK